MMINEYRAFEKDSFSRFPNEQEGFNRCIGIDNNEVSGCSSVFCAAPVTMFDFRGILPDLNGILPKQRSHFPSKDRNYIEWETSPSENEEETIFTWIGGSQVRPVRQAFPYPTATLFIDKVEALKFPLGTTTEYSIGNGDFILRFEPKRFQSLVESYHRFWCPSGVSGFYRLKVPAKYLNKEKSVRLRQRRYCCCS